MGRMPYFYEDGIIWGGGVWGYMLTVVLLAI